MRRLNLVFCLLGPWLLSGTLICIPDASSSYLLFISHDELHEMVESVKIMCFQWYNKWLLEGILTSRITCSDCVPDGDSTSSWCGWHTDHGSLTGDQLFNSWDTTIFVLSLGHIGLLMMCMLKHFSQQHTFLFLILYLNSK
jgi:hypothetical protein